MKIKSLKLKLILSYLFVVALAFGLAAFFLDKHLEENSLSDLKASLASQARLVESRISKELVSHPDLPALQLLIKDLSEKISSRITVIDAKGVVLADSENSPEEVLKMDNHAERPEFRVALSGSLAYETRYSSTLKIDMLYSALPIVSDGKVVGAVRLALPLVSVTRMLKNIRNTVIFSFIFAIGLAFLLGCVLAAEIVKPINKVIYIIRKISAGDFAHRIYHSSKDEIGELAAAINLMAQDLENKIKEVSRQNQHLSAVFNSMIEGVIVVDKTGSIVSVNRTVEKIFGISNREAAGRMFLEAVRNNDIAQVIDNVLKEGKPVSRELALIYPLSRIFEISATPIFEGGSVSGCLVVIHDITEIRRLETVRRDFVANVSHELKTPLTSIKGFVETLLEGALDDKENSRSRQFLKIIQEHADRLNNLINDLLDLSSIESENIALKKEEFDLRQLVEEALSGFSSQIRKKNLRVRNELPAPFLARADRNRINQVVMNLLDNAIKFNNGGGLIKVYSQGREKGFSLTVEDSGIGIPAKDLPRIFERFYRVDKARSRELGGTGLGLSIVKHIVELHGGSVGVESTEGMGSKFWFIIP